MYASVSATLLPPLIVEMGSSTIVPGLDIPLPRMVELDLGVFGRLYALELLSMRGGLAPFRPGGGERLRYALDGPSITSIRPCTVS